MWHSHSICALYTEVKQPLHTCTNSQVLIARGSHIKKFFFKLITRQLIGTCTMKISTPSLRYITPSDFVKWLDRSIVSIT